MAPNSDGGTPTSHGGALALKLITADPLAPSPIKGARNQSPLHGSPFVAARTQPVACAAGQSDPPVAPYWGSSDRHSPSAAGWRDAGTSHSGRGWWRRAAGGALGSAALRQRGHRPSVRRRRTAADALEAKLAAENSIAFGRTPLVISAGGNMISWIRSSPSSTQTIGDHSCAVLFSHGWA